MNQIDMLAKFIQENCPEEVIEGGAGEVAISIIKKRMAALEDMKMSISVQGYDGNWNYDEYMHGMYNGMELMLAFAERREPVFRDAPEVWVRDKPAKTVQVQG